MCRIWLTTILFIVCRGSDQMYRCPSNLNRSQYLKTFGEKCYQFNTEKFIWFSARDTCASHGGLLLQIRTAQIQQFVMESLKSLEWREPIWTGAHKEQFSTSWKWTEGDSPVYTNWAPPFEPFECLQGLCNIYWSCVCLQYSDGGLWRTRRCTTNLLTYICEFDMIPVKSSSSILSDDIAKSQIESTTTPDTVSTSSGEQRHIVAIVLSLMLVVFIAGFASAFMVVKKRRNNHPNQENPVTVNERINVPPAFDRTHVEVSTISENYAVNDEILGPLGKYEKLNITSDLLAGLPNNYTRLTQPDEYPTPRGQKTELEEYDDGIAYLYVVD